MNAILSLCMGYFIGCISPAKLISRRRKVDLKQTGTGNLGATNTALVLGKKAGILVLVFDIFKSFAAAKLAKLMFPRLLAAGLISSIGVLLGHCFPVFLRFQGGKALASYGGLILAYDPRIFIVLLTLGTILCFRFNYGVLMALTAGVLFPVAVAITGGGWAEVLLAAFAGGFILFMHRDNFQKTREKRDITVSEFFKKQFHKE